MHVQHSFSILFVFAISYLTDVLLVSSDLCPYPRRGFVQVCISTYMSHGFENCPCGPLFLLFIYDIVDFMRGAQIQSAGLPRWLHFVMMLINICGSLVWNLLCHSSSI